MLFNFKLTLKPRLPYAIGFCFISSLILSGCGFERIPSIPTTLFTSGDAAPEEYSFENKGLDASDVDIAAIQSYNAQNQTSTGQSSDLAKRIADIANNQVIAKPNLVANARSATLQSTPKQQPRSYQIPESLVSAELTVLQLNASPSTKALYKKRGNKPFWFKNGQWNQIAYAAARGISMSQYEGLPTARYRKFGLLDPSTATNAAQIAAVDLALTEAAQVYLVDLSHGLDPEKKRADGKARMLAALRQGDWNAYATKVRPKNRQYLGLAKVLRSGALTEDQKKTVMINMERFRTYSKPSDSKYIHVNLPTQSLAGYEQSRVAINMPVVIGQLSRQTPVMTDRITDLKFSPDWSVPKSIAKKDMFPILKAKGSELTKSMGLKVYKGSREVNPDTENWANANPDSYRFYQPPGPGNALGGVRFSLTNPRGIYLHDTPSRDLFSRSTRVVSSGCVRVGDASGLATWLMRGTGWDQTRVNTAMKRGKTQTVKLKKDVPVYFTYHTAHVDSKGRFQMGKDIYALDAALGIRLGIY